MGHTDGSTFQELVGCGAEKEGSAQPEGAGSTLRSWLTNEPLIEIQLYKILIEILIADCSPPERGDISKLTALGLAELG